MINDNKIYHIYQGVHHYNNDDQSKYDIGCLYESNEYFYFMLFAFVSSVSLSSSFVINVMIIVIMDMIMVIKI